PYGGAPLAVPRRRYRRQSDPLPLADVVHLGRVQSPCRFLATEADDPAVDERGAVAAARSRHVNELRPLPGLWVEALERRGVLVGGQEPSTHRVDVETIRHSRHGFATGRAA